MHLFLTNVAGNEMVLDVIQGIREALLWVFLITWFVFPTHGVLKKTCGLARPIDGGHPMLRLFTPKFCSDLPASTR